MTMFGHLKAEEFINLIEGGELSIKSQSHLKACQQCTAAFTSAQSLHAEVLKTAEDDENIPEPDWFQFRADVRNSMLSRAAQRQTRTNSWSGFFLRPALTWGLAVAFAAGLSAGMLIWNQTATIQTPSQAGRVESPVAGNTGQVASLEMNDLSNIPDEASLESGAIEPGLTTWSQTSVFEELSQLDDTQAEKLQRMLEADVPKVPAQQ